MKIASKYTILALSLTMAFLNACTSARWTVKDKSAIDREEYRIINSQEFLGIASTPDPENPTMTLQVKSRNTYEFSQKVLAQRTIQDYKLKPAFLILGLLGGGLAAYAANSQTFTDGQSSAASFSLNVAALLMAGSGFVNMQPVGEPRPTGEERFLRTTGTITEQDTLSVTDPENKTADLSLWYGNRLLIDEEEYPVSEGELTIGLGNTLADLNIKGENPEEVSVRIQFNDSTYSYTYGLDHILQPYARVITPVTELRSTPELSQENILAEIVEGSQLEVIEMINGNWFKILYGISENFITQQDAELIWQPSDFADDREVVAVPVVPFGNIDVENNIPILSGINDNAHGLIITNENYDGRPYASRSHANRDGLLMQTYLENALGFPARRVERLEDIGSGERLYEAVENIRREANDSTQIVTYLSGYGIVEKQGNRLQVGYLPVTPQGDSTSSSPIYLREFFEELASIPSNNLVVLADLEFRLAGSDSTGLNDEQPEVNRTLQGISEALTENNPDAAVIFGSGINQHSELYAGNRAEDKKHHLLPYFFARALQERNTGLDAIFQYLQRNIPYTARRLHDRSQDPYFFGNSSLKLTPSQ